MNTLDIEDRLRRTYADVAARTVAAPPGDATLVALTGGGAGPRRWAMLAAAAAVVALVAGGAALLGRDGPAGPAGVDPATLVHALPGYLPGTDGGASFNAPTLPLRSIESSAERDVLTYASDAMTFTMEVDRANRTERPAGEPVVIRGGVPAVATADSLWWREPSGLEITLTLRGPFDPTEALRLTADSIVFVDDRAWDLATANGGFRRTDDPGVVAEYRLDAEVPAGVQIRGRLQWGFEFVVDAIPISQGPPGTECGSMGIDGIWSTRGTGDRATVSIDRGTPFEVRFTDTVPGTATRLAVYRLDVEDGPMGHEMSTTCSEDAP